MPARPAEVITTSTCCFFHLFSIRYANRDRYGGKSLVTICARMARRDLRQLQGIQRQNCRTCQFCALDSIDIHRSCYACAQVRLCNSDHVTSLKAHLLSIWRSNQISPSTPKSNKRARQATCHANGAVMASAIAVTEDDNQHSDHAMDTPDEKSNRGSRQPMSRPISPSGKPAIWVHEASSKEQLEEDKSVQSDSFSRQADVNPGYTMTVVSSRRNANGTVGSVYSGNKIRHLKKDDGIPLWRKDIQYTFLRAVFEDDTKVFTLVDGSKGHSFADIYIDAMARSSKTSRVLKDKLLSDKQSAINMAMICLLVNVGRMNTTLNCRSTILDTRVRTKADR